VEIPSVLEGLQQLPRFDVARLVPDDRRQILDVRVDRVAEDEQQHDGDEEREGERHGIPAELHHLLPEHPEQAHRSAQKAPSCLRSRSFRSLSTNEMKTSSIVGATVRTDASSPASRRCSATADSVSPRSAATTRTSGPKRIASSTAGHPESRSIAR